MHLFCRANDLLGGYFCILIRDCGQLPQVMDVPYYSTAAKSELSDLECANYHMFDRIIVLEHVMRQAGSDCGRREFLDLVKLRNGASTTDDWKILMTQTAVNIRDTSSFENALHLFPTSMAVAEFNIAKIHSNGVPVSIIKIKVTVIVCSEHCRLLLLGLKTNTCLCVESMRVVEELLWINQTSTLLQYLSRIGEVDRVRMFSPDLEWAREIEQDIAASHMDHDSTWGSKVETMVLAHLLDIPIYSYDTTHGWNRYTPGNAYGVFDFSQFNILQMAMYFRYDINHYDVVTISTVTFQNNLLK